MIFAPDLDLLFQTLVVHVSQIQSAVSSFVRTSNSAVSASVACIRRINPNRQSLSSVSPACSKAKLQYELPGPSSYPEMITNPHTRVPTL